MADSMASSFIICHPVLKEEAEFKMLLYGRCLSCFYWSAVDSLINLPSVASAIYQVLSTKTKTSMFNRITHPEFSSVLCMF